jgi:Na+/melibiose symporter-like transporter
MAFFMGLLNLSRIVGIFSGGRVHKIYGYECSLLISLIISAVTLNLLILTKETLNKPARNFINKENLNMIEQLRIIDKKSNIIMMLFVLLLIFIIPNYQKTFFAYFIK